MNRKYQNPKLEVRTDVARHYYFVRVMIPHVDGTSTREVRKLGFTDEISRKRAMELRAELLGQVNSGRVLFQAQIQFKDLVAQFVEARLPQFGIGTQARYRSQIDRHILPVFGEKRLGDLDRQQIEAWLTMKEHEGLSWWSREGLCGVMSSIFSAANDWKLWTSENPATGMRLGRKKEIREKRVITPEDMWRLLASIDDPVRFIVLMIFATGLRISEVLGLRWRNIDLEAGTLSVEQRWYRGDLYDPKAALSNRTRQLGPLVAEFQRRYPGPHALARFVFIGDDEHTPPDERDLLRYALRPVLKKLKLYYPGFGWHAFRRQKIT